MAGPNAPAMLYAEIPFHVILIFVIVFVLYVGGSAFVYAFIEDWSFTDAVYFAVSSISTVGYGDITPSTTGGQVMNLVFIFMSFCGLFVFFRVVVGYVVEGQIDAIITRIKKRKDKKPLWSRLNKEQSDLQKLADEADEEIEEEKDEALTSGRDWRLYVHFLIYVVWLFVWTLFYHFHEEEEFTVFEALYFGVVTSTTIGYGHFHPLTYGGKWFCILLTLIGVVSLSILATTASRGVLAQIKKLKCARKKSAEQTPEMAQVETLANLLDMVKSGERTMTEAEFLCAMLVAAKKVSKKEMDKLSQDFRDLDADKNGVLTEHDFEIYKQQTLLGDDDATGRDYKVDSTVQMEQISEENGDNQALMAGRTDNAVESPSTEDSDVGLQT